MPLVIDKPDLYFDVTAADYHRDPVTSISLSRSAAVTLLTKSPLHCWMDHPMLGGTRKVDDLTADMDFGSVGHKLLLGLGEDIQVGEWDDWRTNAAKDWRKQMRAAGHIAILQKTYERALAFEDGVRKELVRLGLAEQFNAAKSEVVAVWQEDGYWLRAMFDKVWFNAATPELATAAVIYDLKVTESAAPTACERQIANMLYFVQHHWYQRALWKLFPHLAGRTRMIFLFAENDLPFSVTPMDLNGEFAMLGEKAFDRAFALWKKCMASNTWPPYCSEILRASPPGYLVNAEMKREFENQ